MLLLHSKTPYSFPCNTIKIQYPLQQLTRLNRIHTVCFQLDHIYLPSHPQLAWLSHACPLDLKPQKMQNTLQPQGLLLLAAPWAWNTLTINTFKACNSLRSLFKCRLPVKPSLTFLCIIVNSLLLISSTPQLPFRIHFSRELIISLPNVLYTMLTCLFFLT